MRTVLFKALPYSKEQVTLALESGVDGLIVPDAEKESVRGLSRCFVLGESEVVFISLNSKADEELAAACARQAARAQHRDATGPAQSENPDRAPEPVQYGIPDQDLSAKETDAAAPLLVALTRGWEIIPVENLLASAPSFAVEAGNLEEAVLAGGILERGVDTVVVTPEGAGDLAAIVTNLKYQGESLELSPATITRITRTGMGHRVCVDTASLMHSGQGMLVGNSAAFTFLVNAETEHNEYVAARPFRVNAGGVHAYAVMPGDRTAYLDELAAGHEVLIVSHRGETSLATVGRVKVERRPMLLIEAELDPFPGEKTGQAEWSKSRKGAVFLQNAETIRLITPEGRPVSVVSLKPGDKVLCRGDVAGRHFGMRISEEIKEG